MRFLKFPARRNSQAEILTAQPATVAPPAISAFLLGVFTLAATVATAPARAQDAATLISQMRAAESKAQYSGTLSIVRGGQRESARVWRDGQKRRWQWSAPALKKGDVLVDNGVNLYLYHAAENNVTQTQSAPALPNLGGGWKVVSPLGAHYVLTRGAQKLTIDKARKILLRFENGASVYALQNVKFGAQAASLFQFQTSQGAKVTRSNGKLFTDVAAARASANWLKAPTNLPAGYALESAIAAPDEVWLRYSNGKNRFSLFEQRAEAGTVAPTKVDGGYFWKSGGIRYLASGVSSGTAQSLAGSLK